MSHSSLVTIESYILQSACLSRDVQLDIYIPANTRQFNNIPLLLVNDGQDLVTMGFENILHSLYSRSLITEMMCVGIHCSTDRKNEYGTAKVLDYKGRGAKASLYTKFVFTELIPFLRNRYHVQSFASKSFAGFSLGALSALDIIWNHPQEFTYAGIFSASLWWRDKDADDADFDENTDRIMHRQIREGNYAPWLKFFFEVGTLDEVSDRNNNGIIDAIDDTNDLISELIKKGYNVHNDIFYLELADGRHDVPTWARAWPYFLLWCWGINHEVMG